MKLVSHALSECGCVRSRNEDAVLACQETGIFAVADGIGGLSRGDEASAMTLHLLETAAHKGIHDLNALIDCVRKINTQVYDAGKQPNGYPGMGCTLTCLLVCGDRAFIAHVGDSSAFRLRAGGLQLLTDEHTMAAQINRDRGTHDAVSMPRHFKHMLTRCIGLPGQLEVDGLEFSLQPEDKILLCSDGITKVLEASAIKSAGMESKTPRDWVHKLHRKVQQAGAPDNLSSVCLLVMNE
ncbi:MAG: protein phosphatase 2C domain-containing protein [Verrucomicrobia bacterium]|nr:protein phosphatase 2C domain-containing protein [Verrucomicrobiota bacterium]